MANTSRRRSLVVELVHPNGPDIVRMAHKNITKNHNKRREARVSLLPLVSRATLVVKSNRIMPVRVEVENE